MTSIVRWLNFNYLINEKEANVNELQLEHDRVLKEKESQLDQLKLELYKSKEELKIQKFRI